jgi:adenylate cyclase
MSPDVQVWLVFLTSFISSIIVLSGILLNRIDIQALRSMAEDSPDRPKRQKAGAQETPDALASEASVPEPELIDRTADAPEDASDIPGFENPKDIEASIADLVVDGDEESNVVPLRQPGSDADADGGYASDGSLALAEDSEEESFEAATAIRKAAAEPEGPIDAAEAQNRIENARNATASLTSFLDAALTSFMESGEKLGASDKFGSTLFIAGACEAMRQTHGLRHRQFVRLLERALGAIGHPKSAAHRIADKYEEYLMEPQYIGIFRAGSEAINKFADGDERAVNGFADSIKDWRNPKAKSTSDGLLAVMFTDIVGSTKMTQDHGDEGAQTVVRVHNRIVRSALKMHGGTEVKHTGDGIMASFTRPGAAVTSAIVMLEGLKAHNAKGDGLPLHMRIGINSGEPIVEDNDLFGTTVQMAARICDAAETDQLLVSSIVRDLYSGQTIKFDASGQYGMKGIAEPVTLYEPSLNT